MNLNRDCYNENDVYKSHKNNIGLTFSITTASGNVVLKSC